MRTLIHDKANRKFVLELEQNETAEVVYTADNNQLRLIYSEVPHHLRGLGIGKELVEKTFEKLTEEGYQAEAVCSYIRMIAKRSSKWNEIIKH